MALREMVLGSADPRDPAAACDLCGARGTSARASRFGATPDAAPTILKFCDGCWPGAKAALEAGAVREHARWLESWRADPFDAPPPPDGWLTEAPWTWRDVEQLVAAATADVESGVASAADLASLAAGLTHVAPEGGGEPPPGVVAFLRRHGAPAVQRGVEADE